MAYKQPPKTGNWKLKEVRKHLKSDTNWADRCTEYPYRPFDQRFLYNTPNMVDWYRPKLQNSFQVCSQNFAIVLCRQIVSDEWHHIMVVDKVPDDCILSNKSKERGYVFPLKNHDGKYNICPLFVDKISKKIGLSIKITNQKSQPHGT